MPMTAAAPAATRTAGQDRGDAAHGGAEQGVGDGELRDQTGLGGECRRLRFEAAVTHPGASVEQGPGSELDAGHHTKTVRVADWRQREPIGLVLVAEAERGQAVAPGAWP